MISVEKVGGTSMSRFGELLKNIFLTRDPYQRVFVVSAYSGVTNLLLENKKTFAPGLYQFFEDSAAKRKNDKFFLKEFNQKEKVLIDHLKKINKSFQSLGLNVQKANEFIEQRFSKCHKLLFYMHQVLAYGYINRENILLAARELLASIGESHSAFNSSEILSHHGIQTKLLDLSGIEDSFNWRIDQRIKHAFQKIDLKKELPIVTGYTKGTEGIMREFDRGYTEVTFSKIAIHLQCKEAIIHKEYHLSSADPSIVGGKKIIPVCNTNYDVADQLADIGMEAIHPKVARPLKINGINIRVKNAFDPKHKGTLISKNYLSKNSKVEIITGSTNLSLVEIYDPDMIGNVGFDYEIMAIFKSHSVSYITKLTNANSIALIIWQKEQKKELMDKLKKKYFQVKKSPVAMLCLVGSSLNKPKLLRRAIEILNKKKIEILALSMPNRHVNLQIILQKKDYFNATISLHQGLIEK